MELDDTNKVIFEHLLHYARFSVKDLARILKVSEATVIKRIRYLEENHYILRYDAIINWQKLPLIKKVYFIKVNHSEKEFEKKMISQSSVFSLMTLCGLYTHQAWCFFKTKREMKAFERSLKAVEYAAVDISELVFPKVSFFDVPLQLSQPLTKEIDLKLSDIDISIMKYMAQGHGRDSFYDMSKKLKIPYDSVHYHGKNLLKSNYFMAIIAQPGTSQFTLQTTCLLIKCKNPKSSAVLYSSLKSKPHIVSDAICKENQVLVHFMNQTHTEYRETLSDILSKISKEEIKDVLITHWDKILLNNRYPLEYLLD